MGTNYYWYPQPPCECCQRPYEPIHIGKASGGWCFALHVDASEAIRTLEDWIERFQRPGSSIEDEYGERMPVDVMIRVITERMGTWGDDIDETWYAENHAAPGPNWLARSTYRSTPGPGTYDYVEGEFR